MSEQLIEGPFEHYRTHDSWWWERPNGGGDCGYNRPEILFRCQRIWGGRVKVIRQETSSVTNVYEVTR